MGRKKKKQSKPWCWYCNREFDDEKILIQHQKAKHFKCHICHKKLYTGPGLSIHCMQVHKQTIDKVPNSLPNRSNIEIEIYGMEGIPDQDLKDHEKQRSGAGDDDDDGPMAKKLRTDSPGMTSTPPTATTGAPGVMGMVPGMRPPYGMPGAAWNAGVAGPSPATYSGQPTGPNGQPARPLFPSAAGGKSTFPAYGETSDKKPAIIATSSATTRIVHPPEDISLEERRANMPKYASTTNSSANHHAVGHPPAASPAAVAAASALAGPPVAAGASVAAMAAVPPTSTPIQAVAPVTSIPMMMPGQVAMSPPVHIGAPLGMAAANAAALAAASNPLTAAASLGAPVIAAPAMMMARPAAAAMIPGQPFPPQPQMMIPAAPIMRPAQFSNQAPGYELRIT